MIHITLEMIFLPVMGSTDRAGTTHLFEG